MGSGTKAGGGGAGGHMGSGTRVGGHVPPQFTATGALFGYS